MLGPQDSLDGLALARDVGIKNEFDATRVIDLLHDLLNFIHPLFSLI